MSSKYRTAPVASPGLPGGIPYIIGNEAAERFSFYGMKGILVIFMTSILYILPGAIGNEPMPDAEAVAKYHLFTTAVYFTPVIGALISDIFFGKYMTIMLLSVVYCLGHGVLALMGTSEAINPAWMLLIGLGLISLGSGGIKPCVSAHVGDQFGETNGHLLTKIFGWFYFAINTGAFLSTLMTPWFLEWYGPHLAFGVPGVLMVIATIMFWMGRHKFVHVPAGGMAWFRETFSWTGISAILKLVVIYVFVAVFWALFDQTGSSWVLQAEDLDRQWLGITWLPSQIQAVNPVMILIFIPLFSFIIYPAVNKVFTLTPIRKITIGLFIMVLGFGMVSMLQGWIDDGLRPSIGWQIFAYSILTASEVMVSITCLEFSYTQAPRRMKSIIMALFMMSVSLGNLFTAGVNSFIQVESNASPAKLLASQFGNEHMKASEDATDLAATRSSRASDAHMQYETMPDGGFAMSLRGVDGVIGSEDDIKLGFAPNGKMDRFVGDESKAIHAGINRVGEYWSSNDRLPTTEVGQGLVDGLKDPWGQQIRYRLESGTSFHMTSDGPDSVWQSEYDIRAEVTVLSSTPDQIAKKKARQGEPVLLGWAHPKQTWVQRRMAEMSGTDLEADDQAATDQIDETGREPFFYDVRWDVGGATTLAGAAYFWFFTWLMLGTAICFVPVAFLYRPQTYLQEEGSEH